MRIVKCDICKKTLTSGSEKLQLAYAGNDIMPFASFEFCETCSKPIMKILKAKKLIKIRNKKNARKKY